MGTLQGSESQLMDFEMAWEKGLYPCPHCGKNVPVTGENMLTTVDCPHCHRQFFMIRKLGDYFLYEESGKGGMGAVYKAVSRRCPGKILAVKLLAREKREKPSTIKGLLNEAEVGAHFTASEFVAAVWNHGYVDGEYFTVMPFLSGESLDKRIDRLGKLPPEEVLPMMLHLLAAEQHIYGKGYLFRDMKPENVMINDYGYAVLFDFGLCLELEKARHPDDEFINGSAYYMPPERLLGNPEDACSEIYSIGMVAYHALTGHTFYDAGDIDALAARHVATLKVKNSTRMEEIPPKIAQVIDRMIAREPEKRPQSFQEVYDDIKALLDDGWKN